MRGSLVMIVTLTAMTLLVASTLVLAQPKPETEPSKSAPGASIHDNQTDIVTAVKTAAAKDCGCKHCAAMGCKPCHGKNCFFCVAKALITDECGCGACSAAGCKTCGPGCDVCKFHLAPVAQAEKKPAPTRKEP